MFLKAENTINPFKLFPKTIPSGKPSWFIDTKKLRREYRQLQAAHHPDVTGQTACDSVDGITASNLNTAYNILNKPLFRSQYLLKLHGIDLSDETTAKNRIRDHPSILHKIMTIHENLTAIKDEADRAKMLETNKENIRRVENALGEAYSNNDWENTARLTIELQYWENLDKSIRDWE